MTAQPEYKKFSSMLRDTDSFQIKVRQVRENFLSSPIFKKKATNSTSFSCLFSQPIDQQYDASWSNTQGLHQYQTKASEEEEKKFVKLNYSTDSSDEVGNYTEYTPLHKRNTGKNCQKQQEAWNMTPATTASSAFYQSGFNNFTVSEDSFKNLSESEIKIKLKGTPLQMKSYTPFTPNVYTPKKTFSTMNKLHLDTIPETHLSISTPPQKFTDNLSNTWKEKIKCFKFKMFLKIVILLKIKYKKENNRTGNLILSYISRHTGPIEKRLASQITLKIPVPIFH